MPINKCIYPIDHAWLGPGLFCFSIRFGERSSPIDN